MQSEVMPAYTADQLAEQLPLLESADSVELKVSVPEVRRRSTLKEELTSRQLHKLFTKQQRAFYSTYAPKGLELDDLEVLGPINALKLELSMKCAPTEA